MILSDSEIEDIKKLNETFKAESFVSRDVVPRLIESLELARKALHEWQRYEWEKNEKHPCPDPVLRETYRRTAILLTKQALGQGENKKT